MASNAVQAPHLFGGRGPVMDWGRAGRERPTPGRPAPFCTIGFRSAEGGEMELAA